MKSPPLKLRRQVARWIGITSLLGLAIQLVGVAWSRTRTRDAIRPSRSSAEHASLGQVVADSVHLSSIRGRVIDLDGAPVAAAHVCATSNSLFVLAEGICADATGGGEFVLPGVPMGSYIVTAARAGFVTASADGGRPVEVSSVPRTGIEITLNRGGAQVTGLVVDATGGVVPHAVVRGERVEPPRIAVDVEADDLGRFSLWFPPGAMTLSGRATAYAPATWAGQAPTAGVRLVLVPGSRIRGQVVSSTNGAPLARVEIRAVRIRGADSLRVPSSTSNNDGSFEVGALAPGSYKLIATGDGVHGETKAPVRVTLGATIENVRIEAAPAAVVTGRVLLSETHKPCSQGTVRLGIPDLGEPPAETEASMTGPPARVPSFGADINPGGLVRFPGVIPGRYHVAVRCLGRILRDGPRILEVGSAAIADLTWLVGPGPTLAVDTVDDEGRPVAGAQFFLHYPRWTPSGAMTARRTDEKGHYVFSGDLYPGTYQITSDQASTGDPLTVELREAEGPAHVRLKIAGSATIRAFVRDGGGAAIDGLTLAANPQPAAGESGPATSTLTASTLSATALGGGEYRVAPLKPGRYELLVDDGINPVVRSPCSVVANESKQVTIEIVRNGRIRGQVVDDQGAPVPDIWVGARATTSEENASSPMLHIPPETARVLTDTDGRFSLDSLSASRSTYTLRAERPAGGVAVKQGVEVGDANVVITLQAAGRVAGTIVGDCGGVSSIPVFVQGTNLDTGESVSQDLAGEDGSFALDLSPGRVKLVAVCRNGRGHAEMTTSLFPNERVDGLRLVLQASRFGSSAPSGRSPIDPRSP